MNNKNNKKYVYILFAVLLTVRLICITNPPFDYSSWRQCDTDSIARNFVEYKFNIFYPQLNYDGPMPNYVQLELGITPFIIGLLYKLFGYSIVLARLVPVSFFMGSCFYLYLIIKRYSGFMEAIMSVLIYGLLPINIVYSRNIMPESALMFFTIGCIYYFTLWIDTEKRRYYILSAIFTCLTVLTKVPAGLIGIPMIYLCIRKYGMKVFERYELYLFPVIVLGIPYAYFRFLGKIAEQKFVEGIGISIILPNLLSSIFKVNNIIYLWEQFISKVFTIPGIILFLLGIILKLKKVETFYYWWLAAAAIHIILVDGVIHLDYYLMFITPIISIFMGLACAEVINEKKYIFIVYIAIGLIVLNDSIFMKPAYALQNEYIEIGNFVSRKTLKTDLIIIDRDSPELFYSCSRSGWRLYGDMLTMENVNRLKGQGAAYLVLSHKDINNKALIDSLNVRYVRIIIPGGYSIYKLSQ